MNKFKTNKTFFILVGLLIVAFLASFVYYIMQSGKTSDAKKQLMALTSQLQQIKDSDPSEERVKVLTKELDEVQMVYGDILEELSSWNNYQVEAMSIPEVLAAIRNDVGYKDISEPKIREWIDKGDLPAFQSPGGDNYIRKTDLKTFLDDVKKEKPSEFITEEFIQRVVESADMIALTESPERFLGSLQNMRKDMIDIAELPKNRIMIEGNATNLSFEKYLRQDKTPDAGVDLIPLMKQRSAVRDIVFLLLDSGVYEITDIRESKSGSSRPTSFYTTTEFEVSFVAKYPAVAKFITKILKPGNKVMVSPPRPNEGQPNPVYDDLPRNLFVIRDIAFESDENTLERDLEQEYKKRKSAEEAAEKKAKGITGSNSPYTTMPEYYTSSMSGSLGGHKSGKKTSLLGSGEKMEGYYMREIEEAQAFSGKEGRRPNYNMLTVTMKIVFVDLTGEVTGEAAPGKSAKGITGRR